MCIDRREFLFLYCCNEEKFVIEQFISPKLLNQNEQKVLSSSPENKIHKNPHDTKMLLLILI